MMTLADRMARFDESDLYVVITEALCGGRAAEEVLEEVLDAGVQIVQFREKVGDTLDLYHKALGFRERTRQAGALLIIDDRLDIAFAVGADGVHLGQSDLPIGVARQIAPELIIGASSHNPHEARDAQTAGASYVNIGPIFPTETKAVSTGPVGPEMIETIAPELEIPFTCMGGIKAHNIGEVLRRGARHIAVVTAVTQAEDVAAATRQLRDAIAAA